MTNLEEFQIHTDPLDASSLLAIEKLSTGGNVITIFWQAAAGLDYDVEFTTDSLTGPPIFSNIFGNVTATGSMMSVTYTNFTSEFLGFFRVSISEP